MTFEVRSFEARTVSWWHRLRDEIDFNPSYQRRGVVWDHSRQSFLIDSIINGFDIPKLYLADFTYFRSELNSTQRRFAVIDGKQRLTAIFDFLDGKLPLNSDFVFREEPDLNVEGLTYDELRERAPHVASRVENFNLPVMSVITDEERAVQELFIRLNSGKPLTAAERRNAMGGVVPSLVQEVVSSLFFQRCIAFTDKGRAHEQAAAKLLLIELVGGPVDLKRQQLDDLYVRGEDASVEESMRDAAADVLESVGRMAEYFQERDSLLRTQGQLPVLYLLFRSSTLPADVRERINAFHRYRTKGPDLTNLIGSEFESAAHRYQRLMRNPNDARSVYEMFDILRWFIDVYPRSDSMLGSAETPEIDFLREVE